MVLFNRRRQIADSIRLLEYIQSSGTQCINTGFVPNQNTRVILDWQNNQLESENACLYGSRTSTQNNVFALWLSADSQVNGQYGNVAYNTHPLTLNYAQRLAYDFNKNVLTVGGATATFSTTTFNATVPLYILAVNTNGEIDERRPSGKLYSCRIYDNGTLVRDYIPAYDESGVVCLYDSVAKQYVYNAGTDTFTAGPEV